MIKLAFKNKESNTVRVIDFSGVNLIVCVEKSTGRLEFLSPDLFDKDQYKLVKEISRGALKTQAVSLGKYGSLSIHKDDNKYSGSPIVRFDKPYAVKKYLKPVAIAQAMVLILCFSVLYFTTKAEEQKKTSIRLFKVAHVKKRSLVKLKKSVTLNSGIANKRKKVSKKTPRKKRIFARKKAKLAFKAKTRSKKNLRTAYTHKKSKIAKFKGRKKGRILPRNKRRSKSRAARSGTRTPIAQSGILAVLGSSSSSSKHLSKRGYSRNNSGKAGTGHSASEYDGLLVKRNHRVQTGNTLIRVKTKGTAGGDSGYGKSNIQVNGSYEGSLYALGNQAEVYGGLNRSQIEEVIRRHKGQLIYCYETSLQVKPNLSGRVDVKFIIGGNGKVRTAKVKATTLKSKNVENCLLSKLKKWQFPRPVGNVDVKVSYPFNFNRPGKNMKIAHKKFKERV